MTMELLLSTLRGNTSQESFLIDGLYMGLISLVEVLKIMEMDCLLKGLQAQTILLDHVTRKMLHTLWVLMYKEF